jgi:hypothetical protein
MHDHLLQLDILPGIALISEEFAGNYFGTFRDSPNTAASGGLGLECWGGKGARGREEKSGVHGGVWEVNGSFPEQPCSSSVGPRLRGPTQNIYSYVNERLVQCFERFARNFPAVVLRAVKICLTATLVQPVNCLRHLFLCLRPRFFSRGLHDSSFLSHATSSDTSSFSTPLITDSELIDC